MDFVCKLYGNTYAVGLHVTVALVGVATLNLALPAPLRPYAKWSSAPFWNIMTSHTKTQNHCKWPTSVESPRCVAEKKPQIHPNFNNFEDLL